MFLVVILNIWRPKKSFSSISYPFCQGFVVLVRDHPLIIVFECEISFHLFGEIQESFQFDSLEAIISELFIPAFSYHSPNLTGTSFKYSLISSWSLRSLASNSLKYLHSFSNSSRCFFIFSSFIFNSYGGSFKISLPSLSYQFIRGIVEDLSQVCAMSLLILLRE